MHLAAGSALAIMIFTSIASVRKNQKLNRICWPIFKQSIPWVICFNIVGACIAGFLCGKVRSFIFGIVVLLIFIEMFYLKIIKRPGHGGAPVTDNPKIKARSVAFFGSLIGLKSGLLGVGGGAISVPFLATHGLPIKRATGTSSAFTLPIGIVGSICFILIGLGNTPNLAWATGYVYWPAVLCIAPMTMIFAPIGAHVGYKVPPFALHLCFVIFLLFIGIYMLLGA